MENSGKCCCWWLPGNCLCCIWLSVICSGLLINCWPVLLMHCWLLACSWRLAINNGWLLTSCCWSTVEFCSLHTSSWWLPVNNHTMPLMTVSSSIHAVHRQWQTVVELLIRFSASADEASTTQHSLPYFSNFSLINKNQKWTSSDNWFAVCVTS